MKKRDTEVAFKWIVGLLNKHSIPFQFGGGFAARIYGVNRKLADIDIALPTDKLIDLLPDLKKYITYPLRAYKDDNWECTGMTVEYKGQEIDLVGAQGKKFLDKATQKWVISENDFSSSEYKEVYGLMVPIIAKDRLIAYKKGLGRDVDIIDVEALEGTN